MPQQALQRSAALCSALQRSAALCSALQRSAALCSTLQHSAVFSSTVKYCYAMPVLMPVARWLMPVPDYFKTGKCPFARCPIFIKRANARCPLPDYLCPLATLGYLKTIMSKLINNFKKIEGIKLYPGRWIKLEFVLQL